MKVRRELSAREIEQVHESLTRRLGDTSVPTLPQVAMRIIDLISDPHASVADFTETIRTDQALTGRLLRMANSAAYAQRSPVTKIERAMVLIGIEKLKALALGFHLSKVAFDKDDFSFQRIWTQSLFRGWFASRLAERAGADCAGEAFVVALLSDAGLPMMPKLIGSAYRNTVDAADPPAKQHLAESTTLPYTHVDVAAALARLWKLPEALARPILAHHTCPAAVDPRSSASVLHGAAYLAGMVPLDPNGNATVSQPVTSTARRLFAMEPDEVANTIELAAQDFEQCRAVFTHIIDQSLGLEALVEQAGHHLCDLDGQEVGPERVVADSDILRFHVGDLFLELEPGPDHQVIAYLTDAQGNRILSEQINPTTQDEQSVRAALLLDNAPADQVKQVLEGLATFAPRKAA